ncbi:LLM class flavin-dependent oxidoreductase [Cohnella cellulosilytica]|uniref:LLM class flavin-dependent oxidoreductase n=1 Tax=Cohnella cellulosilytica TaxID=986710 RepID=A0ABW2FNX0_9BACL
MNTRKLRLSVLDLVPVLEGADAPYALGRAVELVRLAERLGYRRYWTAEHHDMPGLACTSPEVLLAHIGARTERIRLGSGAVLLPHYKPLKVAESFHMLASLYPGRIDIGLGRAPGGSGEASLALSGNFLENVGKMPELLEDLMRLLQGTYEYDGRPVAARPIPPEPPHPWLLGTNKKSAAYAARFGTGYVFGQFMSDSSGEEALRTYRDGFAPSPLCPEPRAFVAVGVVCADTDEEAERLASSEESPANARRLFAGSPGSLRVRLRSLADSYGVDEFIVVTMLADYRARLRSYELLGQTLSDG